MLDQKHKYTSPYITHNNLVTTHHYNQQREVSHGFQLLTHGQLQTSGRNDKINFIAILAASVWVIPLIPLFLTVCVHSILDSSNYTISKCIIIKIELWVEVHWPINVHDISDKHFNFSPYSLHKFFRYRNDSVVPAVMPKLSLKTYFLQHKY